MDTKKVEKHDLIAVATSYGTIEIGILKSIDPLQYYDIRSNGGRSRLKIDLGIEKKSVGYITNYSKNPVVKKGITYNSGDKVPYEWVPKISSIRRGRSSFIKITYECLPELEKEFYDEIKKYLNVNS